MTSSKFLIMKNRQSAQKAASSARYFEAISLICENVCFILSRGDRTEISLDEEILKDLLSHIDCDRIGKRVFDNFSQSKIIFNGENLEPEEILSIFSLIEGAMSVVVGVRCAGFNIELGEDIISWYNNEIKNSRYYRSYNLKYGRCNGLDISIDKLMELYHGYTN